MPPQTDSQKKDDEIKAERNSLQIVEQTDNHIQVNDKLYDANGLAEIHPGGELFIKVFGGKDATEAFLSYHRRQFPHDKMSNLLVGKSKIPSKTLNDDKDFLELCDRIEKVLPKHLSFAPFSYYIKISVLLAVSFALEFYIHSSQQYKWYLTGLLGLFFAWIGMNIQHDANHGAISRNPKVNRILGMTQNWIGGSALDWIHQHVVQHHINPNDINCDPDIIGNDILRLNPLKPLAHIQLFQHLYIFVLFAIFGISYIFFSFKHLVDGFHFISMSSLVTKYRTLEEGTMLIFFCRWILLPLFQVPSLWTLINILPMFIVGGYYLAFFFLISHNFEGVSLNENRYIQEKENNSFLRRQIETASNVGSTWLCFFNGGLNYQIEHHLFPRIQHSHYPLISKVVKSYCEEKGIIYRHFPTVTENVLSCVRHLYQMGHQQEPPGLNMKKDEGKKTK
jgi:fatty acid desaturase (delta-4 desaturase)